VARHKFSAAASARLRLGTNERGDENANLHASTLAKTIVRKKAPIVFGDLERVEPISRAFGWDRGTPIDRYYKYREVLGERLIPLAAVEPGIGVGGVLRPLTLMANVLIMFSCGV
jgi:hypothetical protein